ncbi:hypothetical protein EXIGLDRAFT_644081 [Exidia glandulosa HHB12029]|uniref:Uncharacterized protein n=1 Tax=Exidia glandulosa HHB12029 TaxID=1314781 RepID=A0A165K015_EXIGL|nr:hypothetical protein EXIGLDRAFT_644081 [Exidia glandulosa HHB12029]
MPLVENPSNDIRGDLEDVLDSSDLDFQGSIAFSRTYDDAPNPTLRLDELGVVGLPLSTTEAGRVISQCTQAPFGQGERTIVDKDVRDTWEMDRAKVHFDNPAWAAFVKRVVKDVCHALGVNREASKPRCDLHKLLLYETGLFFLPHVDTEKANGMFASVIIVLPTQFTGGDAHLSHGSQSMVFNSSGPSLTKTTVLAWYTDVKHEIKPITSGYRLALSYNLVHTTTSLRPSLADNTSSFSKLRHIMLSWKQGEEVADFPDKIVYELDHQYSQANLSASALKGSDAHTVAVVDQVAKELGICMGLAQLELHINGGPDMDGDDSYYGRPSFNYYDGPGDNDYSNVRMSEVYDRNISVKNLVDLDGKLLDKSIDVDDEMESIPREFITSLEDCDPDKQTYQGYMGNEAGTLDRYYRRTVLVIWPRWGSLGGRGDRRTAHGIDTLRRTHSTEPTPQEIGFFFDVLHSRQSDTFELLCGLARQWRRCDLWEQVIVKHPGKMPFDEILSAVSVFGFDKLRAGMQDSVRSHTSNSARFLALSRIKAWARSQPSPTLLQDAVDFVHEQVQWLLEHLCTPAANEMELLTEEALTHGGVPFLQSIVLPQIITLASEGFLEQYAAYLHQHRDRLAATDDARSTIAQIIGVLMSTAFDKVAFFPEQLAHSHYGSFSAMQRPQIAFDFIKRCLDFGDVSLGVRAIERMVDMSGVAADLAGARALSVLLPLAPLLAADIQLRVPPPSLPLDVLCETAIRLTVESDYMKKGELSKEVINSLLSAVALSGNDALLTSLVLPKLKALPWVEWTWKSMIEQLHARSGDPAFAGPPALALQLAVAELIEVYARQAQLSASQLAPTLAFALKLGGDSSVKIVLDRLLAPRQLNATYISQNLIPAVDTICSLASTQHIPLSTEPFASSLRQIMQLWIEKVLGPKPNEKGAITTLGRWTCGCADCTPVVAFLTADVRRELRLERIGAPRRKHLEGYLGSYARSLATFETIRSTPQGLRVVKTDALLKPATWKANQAVGLRALQTMGKKEAELRGILGEQYTDLVGALTGVTATAEEPLVTVPQPQAVAGPSAAAVPVAPPAEHPPPAAPVTPAKRKADDVIDLTTPPIFAWMAAVPTPAPAPPAQDAVAAVGPMDVDVAARNDVDEDGLPIVKNPCTAFRADLQNALKELDFEGNIAFSHTYHDAPNPTLRLDNLGLVGLPLSTREARAVIDACVQAPFGKGERTVVDKEVRDTWEMDAAKVHFDNPAWKAFVTRVVGDVCQELGVNVAASKPRCKLYKLLLYETGSHFLPHVDTEKANGMFASVIIVLPTPFTGGDAHLSHGGQSMVLSSSGSSLTDTTVLAWYTDVMHEVKPITSGYRLALAYNLVHTTTSLRPSLSDNANVIAKLRHIFLSWKQAQKTGGLDKVIFKLDHDYSMANLSASALKGADANALAAIDEVAKQTGFCLGFAHLEHRIQGAADDDGGGYYGRKRGYYDESESEVDEDEVGFMEVYERETSIENLVDIDGDSLAEDVTFKDSECVPEGFIRELEDGDHDEQEYEGYMGNGAGSLERFYRRTVLVIWPRWSSLGSGGDRRAAYALDQLEGVNSTEPTTEELQYFHDVLQSRQSDTFELLCGLARQWRRLDLWKAVIVKLADDDSVDEIFPAIEEFGFDALRPSLEEYVRSRSRNSQRFTFLETLRDWGEHDSDLEDLATLQQGIDTFADSQVEWLLRNICPPVEEEMQLLTDEALTRGGVQFLLTTIVPQLKTCGSRPFLAAYAKFLHDTRERLPVDDEQRAVLGSIIHELLSTLLDKTDFFPRPPARPQPARGYGYGHHGVRNAAAKPTAVPQVAFAFVKTCLDFGDAPLAARAIERMVDVTAETPEVAQTRGLTVLLPLLPLLSAEIKTRDPPPSLPLDVLGEAAIRLTLDSQYARQGELSKEDIDALLTAVTLSGKETLLTTLVLPKLKATAWNEMGWKAMIEQLYARRSDPAFTGESALVLNSALDELTGIYASKAILSTQVTQHYHAVASNNATQINAVLEFCLKMGGTRCLKIALDRVLAPNLINNATYISNVLVPLIPMLCGIAATHRLAPSVEPFGATLHLIMQLWLKKVLGPKPDGARAQSALAALTRWTCPCAECRKVVTFLNSDPGRELSLQRIGAPKRKHVEGFLNVHARAAATHVMISGSPQGLKVTKTETIVGPATWKANQVVGLRALQSMGKEAELRAIFGDQYPVVVGALNGLNLPADVRPPRPTAPQPVATAVSRAVAGPTPASKPGPALPVTPAKRKAEVVIDLTTP